MSTGEKYKEQELTDLLVFLRVPALKTKEEAWANFEAQLASKNKEKGIRSFNYLVYAIAASIAILIGISSWFIYTADTKVWCPPAQTLAVMLPDGSQVILNAASKVKFNKATWDRNRKVQLEGEAFFKVRKGSKFEVITESGKVTVLGTTFNVYSRNSCLEVYCETGKVAVMSGNTLLLKPGMKAQTVKGSLVQLAKAEREHEGSWQKGEYWFKNTPLKKVIEEMERQFDVTIKYEDTEPRVYSGYFNRQSLTIALHTVLDPMGLKYKTAHKTIYIINNNLN